MSAKSVVCFVGLSAAVLLAGCSNDDRPGEAPSDRLQVVATIFPLADVARQIGGGLVSVGCLLGPGQSPHDFEPEAQHAEMLGRAKLLIMVGMGVDEWATRAAKAGGAAGLEVLRLAERRQGGPGAAGHEPDEHPGGHEHEHPGDNPHVWLDPVFMQGFAALIAEAFVRADPAHQEDYLRRRDAYVAELTKLDAEFRNTLAGVAHRHFVSFHPAFTYIARRYDLKEFAIHTADAAGFGPERLEGVVAFIKSNNVRAIFAEPQFPADKLRAVSEQTGARIGKLDPLGNPAVPGYDSYLAMMRSNLRALEAALKD